MTDMELQWGSTAGELGSKQVKVEVTRRKRTLPYPVCVSHSSVSCSLWPHRLWPVRLLCPWNSPGKNTGMGCHFLLQGLFLIQGSNLCLLCLLHSRHILYPLSHQRSHNLDERAAKLFCKRHSCLFDSSVMVKPGKQPRHNQLGLGGCVPKTSIYKIGLQAAFGPSLQFVDPWFILRKCYRTKEIVLLTLNRFTRMEQLFKVFFKRA